MRTNPVPQTAREVGQQTKRIRMILGMSQTEFGLRVGIGREALASYESGRVPWPQQKLQRFYAFLTKHQSDVARAIADANALLETAKGGAS